MKRHLLLNHTPIVLDVTGQSADSVSFVWAGKEETFQVVARESDTLVLRDSKGRQHRISVVRDSNTAWISGNGRDAELAVGGVAVARVRGGAGAGAGPVAPMPGKVFKLLVSPGDMVERGQTLVVLEAMKMEHPIKADKDGKVRKLACKEGDMVQGGALLVELE